MKRGEPPKRRSPLQRSAKPLKRVALKLSSKPLPKRSKKKLAALGDEIAFRDAVRDRAHGSCEVFETLVRSDALAWQVVMSTQRRVCGVDGRHPGAHAHHVLPRSKGGPHNADRNGLWLCARAHDWIHHQHPGQARELGLLR